MVIGSSHQAITVARHYVRVPSGNPPLPRRHRPVTTPLWRWYVRLIPSFERAQRRVRQRPLQIAPYAREMPQVLRLAAAAVEPGEDTEDFRGGLGHQGRIDLD